MEYKDNLIRCWGAYCGNIGGMSTCYYQLAQNLNIEYDADEVMAYIKTIRNEKEMFYFVSKVRVLYLIKKDYIDMFALECEAIYQIIKHR